MSASNSISGASGVWYYNASLTNAQKLNLNSGIIPAAGSSNWTRLFLSMDDGVTLNRDGETIDIGTLEEGLKKVVVSGIDRWSLEVPIADIDIDIAKKFMLVNPALASSSGTGVKVLGSYIGENLLDYGYAILIAHKEYAGDDYDTPPITDPNTWIFANGANSDRSAAIDYDPSAQQIYNVNIAFNTVASSSGAPVFGWHGAITTTS